MDSDFLNFMGVFLSIGLGGGICFGSIYVMKALASRLERPQGEDLASLDHRTAVLEESAASRNDLEAFESRIAELEERLDFAERMLIQRDAPERLPEGR